MSAFERTASIPSAVQTVTDYLTPESWAVRQLFSALHKIEPEQNCEIYRWQNTLQLFILYSTKEIQKQMSLPT